MQRDALFDVLIEETSQEPNSPMGEKHCRQRFKLFGKKIAT
jgi:hypothetical protein